MLCIRVFSLKYRYIILRKNIEIVFVYILSSRNIRIKRYVLGQEIINDSRKRVMHVSVKNYTVFNF